MKRNMLQFIQFDGMYLSICHSIRTFIYSFLKNAGFSLHSFFFAYAQSGSPLVATISIAFYTV